MSRTKTSRRLSALTLMTVLGVGAVVAFNTFQPGTAAGDSNAEEAKKLEEKAPVPVQATRAEVGRIASYLSATSNLVPENEVQILAEWEGRVALLEVEEGDRVGVRSLLAELDRRDGEISFGKAQIKAKTQRVAFERAERLKQQELISNEAFDQITLESEIAGHELEEAQWRLEKTEIRAPFAGHVTQRLVQLGQHVRPGDELFTVADFDPLVARIYLPESDVLTLEEGREVELRLQAAEAITFSGKIRQISPVVDTATGTVKVTIEARDVPAVVRPGAFVRIDIVQHAIPEAILIPREAVVRELQNAYVFVAADGVASKRQISLGLEERGLFQVVDGLEGDELLVVAGQGGLKDGAAIDVLGEDPVQTAAAVELSSDTDSTDSAS